MSPSAICWGISNTKYCIVPWRRLGHTPHSREGSEAAATAARHLTGIGPGVVLSRVEDAHISMMDASCTVIGIVRLPPSGPLVGNLPWCLG